MSKTTASSKASFKKLLSILLSPLLALGMFVGVSAPANANSEAGNDLTTFLDENFNQTGYLTTSSDADRVEVVGVLSAALFVEPRKFIVSIEDGKVIVRAYEPSNVTGGNYNGWGTSLASKTVQFDYGLDTSFDTDGVLDLGFTGVTDVLMPSPARYVIGSNNPGNYELPYLIVSDATDHTFVRLNSNTLETCDNSSVSCLQSQASIKTALLTAADDVDEGPNVVPTNVAPTGFSMAPGATKAFVTGVAESGLPFVATIDVATGNLVPAESFVVSSANYPAAYPASGWDFVPFDRNMASYYDTSVYVLGNLVNKSDATDSVGVAFKYRVSTRAHEETSVIDVGTASTTIGFVRGYAQLILGGSYSDGGVQKPFLSIRSSSTGTFDSTKLPVDSSTNETLLGAAIGGAGSNLGTAVMAVGSDGGKARVYTWNKYLADAAPLYSAIETFGGISAPLTSAMILDGNYSQLTSSGLMVVAAYEDPASSAIVIGRHQASPAEFRLNADLELAVINGEIQVDWSQWVADPTTRTNLRGPDSNSDIELYNCGANPQTASSQTVSAAAPAVECVRITSGVFNGRLSVYSVSVGDHIIARIPLRFDAGDPGFFYFNTASYEVTSADQGGGGGSTPQTPSVTSPTITDVIPKRGGAEVTFTPPAGNPTGTTYTVSATDGTNVFTGSGTGSPITVGGLEEGTQYTFTIRATGPNGTQATPSSGVTEEPLQPGSEDGGFFSGSINIPPSIAVPAESELADSGVIYMISSDVRRILPTGVADSSFGTSGTFSLPGGVTGTIIDIAEVPSATPDEPDLYILVQDQASPGTLKVIKTNNDGVVDTTYGTAGVTSFTTPTAPAGEAALPPVLTVTGSTVGVATPSVNLPGGGVLGGAFAPTDVVGGTTGSDLENKDVVAGLDGNKSVVAVVVPGVTPTIDPGFNSGAPVVDTPTTGTTQMGGLAVDDDDNIYVSKTINGETAVFAYTSAGAPNTDFGDSGKMVISGATSAGNIEVVDDRILVTSRTSTATTVRALYTPAGFNALPVAVSSSVGGTGSGGNAPSFAGPIVSGIPAAGVVARPTGTVRITGTQLLTVTAAEVGEKEADILSQTDVEIAIKLPSGLALGTYDLVLISSQGLVTIKGAIRIESAPRIQGNWTKALETEDGTIRQVKMYARNVIGAGKVQFFQNGKEIAWVRAVDETNPKLRLISEGPMAGTDYLVRTVTLLPGKNALEIYVDNERVWRAAYTLRD